MISLSIINPIEKIVKFHNFNINFNPFVNFNLPQNREN